jgi:hypothetical protein
VATILDAVTDDVDWSSAAASRSAPWYGRRIGKDAVTDYFASIGGAIEVLYFTQLSFAANDTEVMVLSRFRARAEAARRRPCTCTIIGAFATAGRVLARIGGHRADGDHAQAVDRRLLVCQVT